LTCSKNCKLLPYKQQQPEQHFFAFALDQLCIAQF
jgi:hypothetical protein